MHDLNKLAVQLHNKYQPSWELSDSTELVWKLKLNCMEENDIKDWFEFASKTNKKNMGITVTSLPDDLNRTDWR